MAETLARFASEQKILHRLLGVDPSTRIVLAPEDGELLVGLAFSLYFARDAVKEYVRVEKQRIAAGEIDGDRQISLEEFIQGLPFAVLDEHR